MGNEIKNSSEIRIGNFVLSRRSILFFIFVIISLFPFVFLIYKQIELDSQRMHIQKSLETRFKQPPVKIESFIADAADLNFRRAKIQGVFEKEFSFLLNSAVETGQAGYFVITPFRIGDSQTRVLVNRGWIPISNNINDLPVIEVPTEYIELHGIIELPRSKRTILGPINPITASWPAIWPFLDMDYFISKVPYQVQPFIVLMDTNIPHGYTRQWSAYITRK